MLMILSHTLVFFEVFANLQAVTVEIRGDVVHNLLRTSSLSTFYGIADRAFTVTDLDSYGQVAWKICEPCYLDPLFINYVIRSCSDAKQRNDEHANSKNRLSVHVAAYATFFMLANRTATVRGGTYQGSSPEHWRRRRTTYSALGTSETTSLDQSSRPAAFPKARECTHGGSVLQARLALDPPNKKCCTF